MVTADASCTENKDSNHNGNILLLSEDTTETTDLCHSLLTQSPSETRDVLGIAIDISPDSLLRHWHLTNKQQLIDNYGFVDIDDCSRSTTGSMKTDGGARPQYSIRLVDSPNNLAAIGSQLTTIIDEWNDNQNHLVVCVYSLTTLIQHTQLSTLYQFISILTRQLKTENATAHYHVDPTQIDPQDLNVLKHLFDTTIDRTNHPTQ